MLQSHIALIIRLLTRGRYSRIGLTSKKICSNTANCFTYASKSL